MHSTVVVPVSASVSDGTDTYTPKRIYWSDLSAITRSYIFAIGCSSAVLQFMFLMMLMLEKPGWIFPNGRVKFISDALADHQGVGASLIILFLVSNSVLGLCFLNYGKVSGILIRMLLALPISAGFCVVAFKNNDLIFEHLSSTALLFASYFSVLALTLYTANDSMKVFDKGLGVIAGVSVFFFVWFYYMASGLILDPKSASNSAVFEFVAVFCLILFNFLVPFRVRDHLCREDVGPVQTLKK
jgi:hypothetical protein